MTLTRTCDFTSLSHILLLGEAESLRGEMDSLQEAARQQLVSLSEQGENAVSLAQQQLLKAHQLIEQFHLLIKVFSSARQ